MNNTYDYSDGEYFGPEPTYGEISDLSDYHCPECGAEFDEPEEINGKYWPDENYQEVDAYKYTCPECGKVFYTKERL